jgi:hypothetical protein
MRENDTSVLRNALAAQVVGDEDSVVLPRGTWVTVVMVYGDPLMPTAYEVEAYLPETDRYAIATLPAEEA